MTQLAQGSIVERPLARTMYALLARRFTGELSLNSGGREYKVAWKDGAIVAAASAAPGDALGRIALDAGLITPEHLSDSLKVIARNGKSTLQLLAEISGMSDEAQAGLQRRAMALRAMRLFAPAEGTFSVDDTSALAEEPVPPLDGRWVIYHGLSRHCDGERLQRELSAIVGDNTLQLRPEALPVLPAFGFSAAERDLLIALRDNRHTLTQLEQMADSGGDTLAVVYALACSNCLGLDPQTAAEHAASRKHVIAPPPEVAPAESVRESQSRDSLTAAAPETASTNLRPDLDPEIEPDNPEDDPFRASSGSNPVIGALVAEKLALLEDKSDYYALFGVEKDADAKTIQRSYFALAKQLHPDRLRATGIDNREAETVFAVINQAFAVLADRAKRDAYDARIENPDSDADYRKAQQLAAQIFGAEEAFILGEMALKRGAMAEAVKQFSTAVALNPDEGEHHALLAWATWCAAPESERAAAAKATRSMLRRAMALSPKCISAYLYRGKIARQRGQMDTARECFSAILELQPGHRDAETELRLMQTREESIKKGRFWKR